MAKKPRKTLGEMAAEGDEPMQIAGQPACVCPYCGCAIFAYRTNTLRETVHRYMQCRNSSCGKRFVTKQTVPTFLRELE
jgi:hypothetical protein